MRRAFLSLLPLLLAVAPARSATLSGVVLDADSRAPLPYAAAHLEGEALVRDRVASTDGAFSFVNLPAGSYTLTVRYLGYREDVRELTLTAAQELAITVRLRVEAIRMETREVIGDRNQEEREIQPGFVDLDADELLSLPAFGEADPIRALQLLPGVQAASDISSGLYVRGGGPDQNLVLLDGVPIYNPTHAFGLFSTFNPEALDEVTLYKGAYPAKYGGRLGSVLDVRSQNTPRDTLDGTVGASTIAARLFLEGKTRGAGWTLGLRRTYLEPLLSLLRRSEPDIPSYYFYDLNGTLRLPSRLGATEIRAYFSRDDLGVDLDEDTAIGFRWGNSTVVATQRLLLGESTTASLTGFWSRYRSDTGIRIFSTPIDFGNRIDDLSVQGALGWRWGARHRLAGGLGASRYDIRYLNEFNGDRQIDYRQQPDEFYGFLEDTFTPRPGTRLRGGLRLRRWDTGDRWLAEPRLSLRQELGERWAMKLGGGLYHQLLQLVSTEGFTATDFYVPIDDTADPSRSWQLVAGLEYEPSPRWSHGWELYYTDLQDLVVLDPRIPADQDVQTAEEIFITGGTGWAAGFEWFAQRRLGRVTGWLGYTLGWTRRSFPELNRGEEFPPKYDRRHDLNLVLRYPRGRWEFSASFLYGTGQAFTPAAARYGVRDPATGQIPDFGEILAADRNSARLLPYHRLDLSATYAFRMFSRDARLRIQLFNAYSHRNDWFVQYDTETPNADPEIVKQLPVIPSLGLEVDF